MLHPSQSGPCSTLSSDLESSCLASLFVWQNLSAAVERGFLSFSSPGFLKGYHALPFLAFGSPLVWIAFGPMHWLPPCPQGQTPWWFLPRMGSVPLQGDLGSSRREG